MSSIPRRRPAGRRCFLEALEDRCVLSVSLLGDLNPVTADARPHSLAEMNRLLFFAAAVLGAPARPRPAGPAEVAAEGPTLPGHRPAEDTAAGPIDRAPDDSVVAALDAVHADPWEDRRPERAAFDLLL